MPNSSFPGTSKVMIFIDGHYLAKNIAEKSDRKINYDKLARHLNMHARFDNRIGPILIRAYYYDGQPDVRDAESFEPDKQEEIKKKIENAIKTQENELTKKS